MNSLEVGAHVGHPGLPVPSVQHHLSPRSARDGHRHFHRQARLIEQVRPVVLGDVFFLAVFLVELEEIERPVGDNSPAAHRVQAVLVLSEMHANDVEAKGLTEGSDGFVRRPLAITISEQARDQSRAAAQGSPVKKTLCSRRLHGQGSPRAVKRR